MRTIHFADEFDYIYSHENEIRKAVGEGNTIIFTYAKHIGNMKPLERFKIWELNNYSPLAWFQPGLHDYFISNNEFEKFCIDNYNPEKRQKNLIYYLTNELDYYKNRLSINRIEGLYHTCAKAAFNGMLQERKKYETILKILLTDIDKLFIPQNTYIYGQNDIVLALVRKLKGADVIKGIVVDNVNELNWEGINIVGINEIYEESMFNILVVDDDVKIENIKKNINKIYGEQCSVFVLDDITHIE